VSEPIEPGMKVECIDEFEPVPGCVIPAKGRIYTVRAVVPGINFQTGSPDVGLWLHEIVNPILPFEAGERAWHIGGFRPIRNRATDISIFREIDAKVFSRKKVRA